MVHCIKHKFRNMVYLPYQAVERNLELFNDNNVEILTADGVRCKLISIEEVRIKNVYKDIQKIYGCDIETFLDKWVKVYPFFDKDWLLRLEIEKK